MRTTVTLDKDVERMLRNAMHRHQKSFKHTLNAALRAALAGKRQPSRRAAFVVKPKTMRLRPGLDPTSFNRLADDLETDSFLTKKRRRQRS